jgi:hypothetical protein
MKIDHSRFRDHPSRDGLTSARKWRKRKPSTIADSAESRRTAAMCPLSTASKSVLRCLRASV